MPETRDGYTVPPVLAEPLVSESSEAKDDCTILVLAEPLMSESSAPPAGEVSDWLSGFNLFNQIEGLGLLAGMSDAR